MMVDTNTADLGQTLFQQGMYDYMRSNIYLPLRVSALPQVQSTLLLLLGPNSFFGLFDGSLVRLRVCRGCGNRVIRRLLATATEGYAYRQIVLRRF